MNGIVLGAANALRSRDGRSLHPLVHVGKWLAADLLSTLFFVGVFAVTKNVFFATGLGIGAGVAQIVYLRLRGRPIDFMQGLSLGLVVLFGGASFVTHDPRFIMIKPTLIYLIIAAGMLKKGWMARYMPPGATAVVIDVTTAFGYVWAGLMALTGILNLALALGADTRVWAWFLGVFPVVSKVALVLVQYAVTKAIARSRLRLSAASPS